MDLRTPLRFSIEAVWSNYFVTMKRKIKKELDTLLERKIITHVVIGEAVHYSQVIVINKEELKGVRISLDNRKLNTMFHISQSLLPPAFELACTVPFAWVYYSVADVKKDFFNLSFEGSFSKCFGFDLLGQRFKFMRLVQGFASSSALFHSSLQYFLSPTLSVTHHLQYVDDMLVGGETLIEHNKKLYALLYRLTQIGFKLVLSKLKIDRARVQLLGYTLSKGILGVQGYVQELKAKLPLIKGRATAQQAVGLLNFIKPMVHSFSVKVTSLYKILETAGIKQD